MHHYNRDGLRLPAKEVLLTLRLAAAFGSEEQFNAAFEPGAVTSICGIASKEMNDLAGLLNKALLPPGWSGAGLDASEDNTLIVLAPNINVTPLGLGSMASFWMAVAASLSSYAPAIYLFCADEPVPDNLKAALPPPLSLPPADRDVAMRVLLERFAGTTPETARRLRDEINNTLPAGDKLKPLSTELICYAARSATIETALSRLCRSVVESPTPSTRQQQTLEGLTVSHPASSVLLRAVDDLKAWQNGMVPWSEMTRSFLLHGEPGVGKSWIAQAFGNSADVPFIQGSFAEWQSAGHLGEMLAAMRDTFKRAAKSRVRTHKLS